MAKRSLKQIQEILAEQFYKYRRRGDDPGPEMGGGSFGLGGVTRSPSQFGGGQGGAGKGAPTGRPKVWRGPEGQTVVPKAVQKPRITPAQAREYSQQIKKDTAQAVKANREKKAAEQPGKETISPPPQTPQEKLVTQAQQRARDTGEPTVAVTDPRVSKILDKLFPEKTTQGPKVWRTPDGKSSSKPPERTERSPRTEIPGLSAKEKRSAMKKSAAVHGAAAAAAMLGLSQDKDVPSGGATAAADDSGVTWVDTFAPADKSVGLPAATDKPEAQEPEIPDPEIPLQTKPVEPEPVITPVTEPSNQQSQATKPKAEPIDTSSNTAPGTVGQDTGERTSDTDKQYRYLGLPFKEQALKEKYTNFLNEETAKEKFLQRVIGPESGGKPAIKNPLSSATGLFQFTTDTWKGIVAKAKPGDPHYGVSFEEMPRNVSAQRAAAKQIADEYARTIKRSGLPDIPTSYYLLHGHGPKAVEIYKNPDKQLKDIYPEYVRNKKGEMVKSIVYQQNPNFNPNQRLGDFVAKRAKQMGDKLTDVFPTATAGELSAQSIDEPKPGKVVKKADATKKDKPAGQSSVVQSPVDQKPIGTLVQPDYSKYNVGDLGTLEKIGPGRWRSSTGQIVTDAPELDNLPSVAAPETFLDKVKRALPPSLGGGGELVSQVFGDRKKSTAPAAAPVVPPELKKTDPAYEPGTAEYDARMEKLQIAAGDKFSREREARLKAAAKKSADGIELQRDQTGLVKAKRELSDFERAFAAARAEKGPGATFSYTDPRTGKTELKTTAYKGEKPSAKAASAPVIPAAIVPANTSADSVMQSNTSTAQSDQGLDQGEEIVNIPVTKSTNRAQDLERIIKQADEPVGTPAARTADELASDELWKDTRSEWNALSQDEQQQRVRDAKLSQAEFDELVQTPELKESINTASHAELHDILRLAGRTK
jgi:hypothetical protein